VHQTIQDGIGQRGVADGGVPVIDGQLAGNDGRARSMSVVEHFQQVAPVQVVEGGQPPVVDQ
jgi:hypothetical protein